MEQKPYCTGCGRAVACFRRLPRSSVCSHGYCQYHDGTLLYTGCGVTDSTPNQFICRLEWQALSAHAPCPNVTRPCTVREAMGKSASVLSHDESEGRPSVEAVPDDLRAQVAAGQCVAIRGEYGVWQRRTWNTASQCCIIGSQQSSKDTVSVVWCARSQDFEGWI